MSQTVLITITNSGPDLGPYNLFYGDGINPLVDGPVNVLKSDLQSGYPVTISDTITFVRVQSVNPTCVDYYLDLTI